MYCTIHINMHQQIFYFIFLCYFCDFVTIERLIFCYRSFINPHLSVQRLDDRSANEHFGTLFRRSLKLNLQQIFCPFLLANSWMLHICPTVSNTAPDFLDFCHVVIVHMYVQPAPSSLYRHTTV